MDKDSIKKELNEIETIIEQFQEIQTFNNTKFSLILGQKMVFQIQGDEKFYRLSRPEDFLCRRLIKEFCAQRECDIFMAEELDYQTEHFYLSSQEAVKVATPKNYMEEFAKYCDVNSLQECFKILGILENDFLHSNMGYDKNGRLKVFDCISNVAIQIFKSKGKIVLYNQYAEAIYESKL